MVSIDIDLDIPLSYFKLFDIILRGEGYFEDAVLRHFYLQMMLALLCFM